MTCRHPLLLEIAVSALLGTALAATQRQGVAELAEQLRQLPADTYPGDSEQAKELRQAWPALLREQIWEANRRSTADWQRIQSRQDWEKFREQKLQALRQALNIPRQPPRPSRIQITKRIRGEGYQVENLLYETRPGLWVSANLYVPEGRSAKRPGLLIVHSHHSPKWHSELQDMGIIWAKAGAVVLVPDLLGHGERRIHPFVDEKSYSQPFRPSRQDYYFRYNLAAQLYLLGETLMGWLVWDLRCAVSVLLEHALADPNRIGILGAVAGGGDVAAVTAAVDERISVAVIFNFGGPEPEDPYPLPQDAVERFNYAGSGSWESTRNLIRSARDGFLPWVVVGSIAPRALCYAHEFSWDRERDPVWPRLQRIWGFYDAQDKLRSAHGQGVLTGRPPENTHCTHIGAVHRRAGVYQALNAWFALPVPEQENSVRHTTGELTCWTTDAREALKPIPWPRWLLSWFHDQQTAKQKLPVSDNTYYEAQRLWAEWEQHQPRPNGKEVSCQQVRRSQLAGADAFWYVLRNVDGMPIPVLLVVPRKAKPPVPCVVVLCSQGKARFVHQRSEALARLLASGVAVCLADVRDCGETATSSPGRNTASVAHAATSLMLGQHVEELRFFDALAVVRWLRGQTGPAQPETWPIDPKRLAIWGENLAPTNPVAGNLAVPWDAAKLPHFADPSGPRVALQLAVSDGDLRAVYAAGEVASYALAYQSPFLFLPLTSIRPGMLRPGSANISSTTSEHPSALHADTPALLAHARVPVRLENLVDCVNQVLDQSRLDKIFADTLQQPKHKIARSVTIQAEQSEPSFVVDWFTQHLVR